MNEKRKEKRIFVHHFPEIYDSRTHKVLGNLVDLSFAGLRLVSTTSIPVFQEYTLELRLPGIFPDQPILEFRGTSRWSMHTDDSPFHDTGFEISGLGVQQVASIIQVLNKIHGEEDELLASSS